MLQTLCDASMPVDVAATRTERGQPGGVHRPSAGVRGSVFRGERRSLQASDRDLAKPGISSAPAPLLRAGVLPASPSLVDSLLCAKRWVPSAAPAPWSPRGRGRGTGGQSGTAITNRGAPAAAGWARATQRPGGCQGWQSPGERSRRCLPAGNRLLEGAWGVWGASQGCPQSTTP